MVTVRSLAYFKYLSFYHWGHNSEIYQREERQVLPVGSQHRDVELHQILDGIIVVFSLESGQCVQRDSLKYGGKHEPLHGKLQKLSELQILVQNRLKKCIKVMGHCPAEQQSGIRHWV